jgi:hypothetical protein
MMICQLCMDEVADFRLLAHLRLNHPEIDASVESWPDGIPVVYEELDTLEDVL